MKKIIDIFRYDGDKSLYLSLFLSIFISSAFIFTYEVYTSAIRYALFLILIIITLAKKRRMLSRPIIVCCALIALFALSTFVNNEDFRLFSLVSAQMFAGSLIVSKYGWKEFKTAYVSLLAVLCVISLVLYSASIIFPQLSTFNTFINNHGVESSNFVIFAYGGQFRNQGMFWEPGAFQSFISMALLLELSSLPNIRRVILFIVTLLTTFSTTGFVTMAFILLWYFFKSDTKKLGKFKFLILLVIISSLLYYFASDLLFNNSYSTFGKLNPLREGSVSNDGSSVSVRYYALIKPLEVFWNYPILGCGYNNLQDILYSYTYNMNTCSFVNYFAVYGGIFAFIVMIGYVGFARRISYSPLSTLLLIVILFFMTSTENYVRNPFFYMIIFYGLCKWKKTSKLLATYEKNSF